MNEDVDMFPESLANSNDIQSWANLYNSRSIFPDLIRRLVLATSHPISINFRAQEGVDIGGWDGIVENKKATEFVPKNTSGWEMGVSKYPRRKANKDYQNRTNSPEPLKLRTSTFIFCTPRRWTAKNDWVKEKKQEKKWKDIRVVDVDDIITWLINAPGVHVWFSLLIGKPIDAVEDLASWWLSWSRITSPPLSSDILLCGRTESCSNLIHMLNEGSESITIKAESEEEVIAFIASAFESQEAPIKDQLFNKTLIVEKRHAWRYFSSSHVPLILVPKFKDEVLINLAIQNGHQVIIPLGLDHPYSPTIQLPRISAIEAMEVMEKRGVPSVVSRHTAGFIRRNITAYRRTYAQFQLHVPEWAHVDHAFKILPFILIGEWNDTIPGDKAIIEKITGISYQDIVPLIGKWRDTPDPLFRQIGPIWTVRSKEDAWRLVAKYITPEILMALKDVCNSVLLERDPNQGLDQSARIRAEIKGIRKEYSTNLKSGLSDSLAMLGSLGGQDNLVNTPDSINTATHASKIVQSLLEHTVDSPKLWLDLAPYLPSLAEASPEAYISYLEKDLKSESPTLLSLFEPQPGLLSPNYEYPNLLWSLEKLAWSDKYFPRVACLLANISSIEQETRLLNSSFNSLLSFFRLWLPQCGADLNLRIKTIDKIRDNFPDVSWKLLINLLPTGHDFATLHSGPGARAVLWRNWPSEAIQPSGEERWKALEEISRRLMEDVEIEETRWIDLIEHITHLHPAIYPIALDMLEKLSAEIKNEITKSEIWSTLRKMIARNKEFESADWAIPSDQLSILEKINDKFSPDDPCAKNKWLFKYHPQMSKKYDTFEDRDKALERLRVKAIEDILKDGGIELVFSFSEIVEVPSTIGSPLFTLLSDSKSSREIIDGLNKGTSQKQLAQTYIRKAIQEKGNEWQSTYLDEKTMNKWQPETRAAALLCLPFNSDTLDLVESYDEDTQNHYWSNTYLTPSEEPDLFHRAMNCLIKFGYPRKAISIIAMYSYDGLMPLDPSIVQQALYLSAQVPIEQDPTQLREYDIRQILGYYRSHTESDKELLEQLEWIYLPMLYSEPQHLSLHSRLNNDPSFFVEVVGLRYKKDNSNKSESVNKEDSERARYLLDSWQIIPGMQSNRKINAEYLNDWLEQALSILKSEDLLTGGLITIGQLLYWGPAEQDGIWPDPIICDILSKISNDIVDSHFHMAVINNRGITSRSPFVGGEQEYELSEKYEIYAKNAEEEWPRVSDLLRRIALEYKSEAQHHDNEAERDEDKLG